jgi:hypothetical protein
MGRAEVLLLYRQLIKEAKKLPTAYRQEYVIKKVRFSFQDAKAADEGDTAFLLRFGWTQLENLQVQQELLNDLQSKGQLKS